MTPETIAVILKAQGSEMLSMMAWMPNEKMRPPTPEPAELIPSARLRFLENH